MSGQEPDQLSKEFRSSLLGGLVVMGLLCASLLVLGIAFPLLDRYRWKESILLLLPTLWFSPLALRQWADYRKGMATATGTIVEVRRRERSKAGVIGYLTFEPEQGRPIRLIYNSAVCTVDGSRPDPSERAQTLQRLEGQKATIAYGSHTRIALSIRSGAPKG